MKLKREVQEQFFDDEDGVNLVIYNWKRGN